MEDYKTMYEQALERAKKYHEGHTLDVNPQSAMEYVFPVLRENGSEKIRKEIIQFLQLPHPQFVGKRNHEEWITWLEKQGEQKTVSKTEPIIEGLTTEFQKQVSHLIASAMDKEYEYTKGYVEWVAQSLLGYAKNEQTPTNKVEPKFHAGDFITDGERIFQIEETIWERNNRNDVTTYCESLIVNLRDGITYANNTDLKEYHLWTIQDVKDGDVLSFNDGHGNDSIELIKSITGKKIEFWFCLTNGNRYEVFDGITPYTNFASRENATPATREQRDLLFIKIKEAGYEWDSEKKELKKIEQKPAWSEEEKARIDKIIDVLDWAEEKGHIHYSDWEDYVCYVKTLRPQNTWKPSDEQMETIYKYSEQNNYDGSVLTSLYRDLKKLKG